MKPFSLILLVLLHFQVDAQDSLSNDSVFLIKQNDILNTYNNRKKTLLVSEISAYAISLFALNQLWYSGYPRSKFHFINDNKEWLQMDKVGHMTTTYYTGVAGIKAYKWAGFKRNEAIWYGGITGSVFLMIIEILDGTSKEWGASSGDLLANTAGSLLAIGQELKWNQQKIQLKYSYSPSRWAKINPQQLGYNHLERSLKDYNGQTYWVSFNVNSTFNISKYDFPNWLNLALGYGADGMTSPYTDDYQQSNRQFLMSFDIDLSKIKTKSKTLNSVLNLFGFLKFPAPAIEFTNNNFLFHSIYF